MKKNIFQYIIVVFGLALSVIGIYIIKTTVDPIGIIKVAPYLLIGLGCGLFGHGMGEIIRYRLFKKYPEEKKKNEIEKNDERNIEIGNCAKAKAYDMMIYIFGALLLVFALLEINLAALLLLVFAYLFVIGYGIYWRYKYEKIM